MIHKYNSGALLRNPHPIYPFAVGRAAAEHPSFCFHPSALNNQLATRKGAWLQLSFTLTSNPAPEGFTAANIAALAAPVLGT